MQVNCMAPIPENVPDVARAIQLALAPVFLLTGIAGMLNVMAGRLSRIIDRGRTLIEGRNGIPPERQAAADAELKGLEQRRHFASIAITACTVAALLLCMVIVTLFLEALLNAPLSWLVGSLFAASTMALIVGLAYFLREVHLAMQSVRIR
jgi:hypothetical protein